MIRTFLRGINVSFLLLIIIFTFSSCANEMNIFGENNNKQINFSLSIPEWKNTDSLATTKTSRAMPITGTLFGTDKAFGMIADVSDGSNYTTEIDKEVVLYNTVNKMWETTADHYWPGTDKTVNFYAYYPTSITNGTIIHTAGTTPTLKYTVPADAATQADIMTSTSTGVSGTTYSSTSVSFEHILAAVKFTVGTSGLPSGTIKSITISGIKNSGTYTFGSGWTLGSTSSSFTVSPSSVITGAAGADITSGTFTMMMIPQSFTNATIILTYNTGTSYRKTISGNWTANNIYTYNLSKSVNVGDYYYSDGTWGAISENPQKVPIAIIFSNITSEKDKKYGFTHGYAMALNNTNAPNCWSLSQGSSDNMTIESSNLQTDYDGYDHFLHISTNKGALVYSATNYPAFYDARNYNVVAPSNSSGWYLPSVGQWFLFISNIGKSSDVTYNFDNQTGSYNIYWTNYASISFIIESVVKNTNSDTFVGYWYWCSSEQNSNYGSLTNISSNSVYTGGADPHKGRNPDDSEKLRSVIAF
ncbi:fimbrillin family protein [Segatella paludivivens]|uniref:fimbrillin family protein n=1 Tax=Segatella paludivivens TaxID=185294 RepID=UPI0003A11EAD|nr:fimbrillin family protein [Segatella paludivivens]